jgi:hypothetical protein
MSSFESGAAGAPARASVGWRQVGRRKSVTPAEQGERNLPGRGLAFEPTLLDPQDQGGFFGRVYGWYALAVMRRDQLSFA